MATDLIVTEEPHACTIKVWHGEDWYDALPQLVHPVSLDPFDLTDVTMELFARPSFDHATRLLLLTSVAEAGIIKENPEDGLSAFFLSQEDVEASLPTSSGIGWRQFLRFTWTDGALGEVSKLIWTGPLIVSPAKDDPSS